MAQTYFAILTAIGEAKLANATALGSTLQLTKMAVGDGNGTTPIPSRTQTALVHENRRAPLNTLFVDPANASQIVAEQIIPEDIGGWWVRELGLYDAVGDLCAVANCPDTYKPVLASGSGRTQIIRMVLIVANTSAVELKIDPSVVLAPRGYVDQVIAGHLAATDPHPQYATDADLAAHKAAADPHPQYATDADLASHAAAADPHPQYLTSTEGDAKVAAAINPINSTLLLKAPLESPALTGDPSAPTQPRGDSSTKMANTEFVQQSKQSAPVRQTAMSGMADANGRANFISAGAGLACNLSATANALTLAFAGGFGTVGAIDYIERITADTAGYWSNLPANNLSFLSITRTSVGTLSAGSTLAPVQYGYSYNQAAHALLHFDGAAGSTVFLDDFGNTWAAQGGAKLQSNWSKFGGSALGGAGANNALDGTNDFISCTSIKSVGDGKWLARGWYRFSGINRAHSIINFGKTSGTTTNIGMHLVIDSADNKLSFNASSNGISWDIAAAAKGTTAFTTGIDYFIEATFDGFAYRVYVNGVQEVSIASPLKICAFDRLNVGSPTQETTGRLYGYIDEFEFQPYCDHPNGSAYSVPTAAKSISTPGYASDWFDLSTYTMKSPSVASAAAGSNPTFTTINKLYVGEAITGAAGVSNVISYAYLGKYDSGLFAVAANTPYAKSHNLGVGNYEMTIHFADDQAGAAERMAQQLMYTSSSSVGWWVSASSRNAVTTYTSPYVGENLVGTSVPSGYYRIRVNRGW